MATRKLVSEDEIRLTRFVGEVTELPKVKRAEDGTVTSAVVKVKARFKGDVTVRLRGTIASAFWSVTPGMKVRVAGTEIEDKDYRAETFEVMPLSSPS